MQSNEINDNNELFIQFFEISVHYILYIREIYPKKLFQKKKKYHMVVYECPKLEPYIKKVIKGIREMLDKRNNKIDKLIVSIFNDKKILENFVFEIPSKSLINESKNFFSK